MASHRRSGHMKGAKGRRKRVRLAAEQGGRCFYCPTRFVDPETEATFDHYLPYVLWPTNVRCNLVIACRGCNEAKSDVLPIGLLLFLWPLLDRQVVAEWGEG